MDFKLIAIDLDGTLLNNDLEISPRAAAAIRAAEKKGVRVTLCTGRMYASASPYAQELRLNIPLITYNGALVKNSFDGEILYEKNLPLEEARHVVEICREFDCQLNVYFDDKLYVEKTDYWAKKYASRVNVPLHEVDDLLDFLKLPPIKLLAMGEEEVLHMIRRRLADRVLYITRSQPHFLEILNPEATKGRGLAAVVKRLAIDRKNVMAIGDNENDIEMFKYAGYSVAMANADDHVKVHADYVTKNNDDDGVAEAIEKLVLI
ncbi:MAG: HAD family phosphatase [Clostridia bacterium]|nr:HAD family phosphatase [Clostridia bacterium]